MHCRDDGSWPDRSLRNASLLLLHWVRSARQTAVRLLGSVTRGKKSSRIAGVVVTAAAIAGVTTAMPLAHAAPPSQSTQSHLQWGACDRVHGASARTQCATLRVPRDYANPAGPTIEVTISRIPARNQSAKRGVLIGNPGGPGGDGIRMFSSTAPPPPAVADEWDLVAVQPRGLVGATPVRCDKSTSSDDAIFAPGKFNRERCERNTPGYTKTLTTETTARDIESARKALGVNKVSLYGISYGTLLMSTYATLFPQHTERLVLDSAVNPAWIWNNVLAEQTPLYKARVHAMMAWIAKHDNVYHLGQDSARGLPCLECKGHRRGWCSAVAGCSASAGRRCAAGVACDRSAVPCRS